MTEMVGREEYSWFNALTNTAPQLMSATYRFRPSTGAVNVIEDTLKQPNGIAIPLDGKTMYISDTGADTGVIDLCFPSIHSATFNATGKQTVYKYDIVDDGMALVNKRAIYLAQSWAPDGLKVAANGMVVTTTGKGVGVWGVDREDPDELYGAEFYLGRE
jgi:sugar lactone lactonase YvrE